MNRENGFTKIPNYLLKGLIENKLNGTQYRILLHILRFTNGFQRHDHELSLSFLSKAIKADKSYVARELNTLIKQDIVEIVKEGGFNKPRKLRINNDLKSWGVMKVPQCKKKSTAEENVNSTVDKRHNTTVDNYIQSTVDKDIHQEIKNKEIKKDIFKENSEDFLY
ncbi:replication protein [Priestia megaterium]|uniref:replication protein n=1 Tax=Priestia megaterium TaxID=1404 RepID=UPI003D28197A